MRILDLLAIETTSSVKSDTGKEREVWVGGGVQTRQRLLDNWLRITASIKSDKEARFAGRLF